MHRCRSSWPVGDALSQSEPETLGGSGAGRTRLCCSHTPPLSITPPCCKFHVHQPCEYAILNTGLSLLLLDVHLTSATTFDVLEGPLCTENTPIPLLPSTAPTPLCTTTTCLACLRRLASTLIVRIAHTAQQTENCTCSAKMSPRRSSRARSSQLPPPGPNHINSTAWFKSKPDRDSRVNPRGDSARRSSTQPSESADGADSSSQAEHIAPGRSRRNGEDKERVVEQQVDDEGNDLEAAEEEITRCFCGQAEYPGPSLALRQQQPNTDTLTDETGNFFVQCDKCSVWQHGGCMGFLDESLLPEEYYCEQCRPEFHKIIRSSNG